MKKQHDEDQDVRLLAKQFIKVNPINKKIYMDKGAVIGIKTWGRIDFLVHYCGYVCVYGDSEMIVTTDNYKHADKKNELKQLKRSTKYHALTNKNNKHRKVVNNE